ncbi:hypothetical protein DOTSEDRAFT_22257 [Dothistroma septosporum NZE10]|uniref:Uncharacterized protein n=1 Tax=Dothistroma septosporum (strain NZE10 / CBS 128990) TaxID=675120 RepID=N1PS03_DOTSN|nr:hypothetical protein DOTSEDRAFT_22257 [Dothistroma septosporum NZE10]
MDQAHQSLAWVTTFAHSPRIRTWIKGVQQARSTEVDDTAPRRGSDVSETASEARVEWERARAAATLEGRMSFDDERRAVWEQSPSYPFATKDRLTVRSSYATANTRARSTSKVPIVSAPLGWNYSSTSPIHPPHVGMDDRPDAWLGEPPTFPTKPSSARLRSSSADSGWTLTPSSYAHRSSWLQIIESGPYVHRTDAPPITRLYADPVATVKDHLAMGITSVEFISKPAQIQRPLEAHCCPEKIEGFEKDAEVLYGQNRPRTQQIPMEVKALRQKELGWYSELPPPTSSGESLFPPVYGTPIQGDSEKGSIGVVRRKEEGVEEGTAKRFVLSRNFWLGVMALLLLGLVCVYVPLAVVS